MPCSLVSAPPTLNTVTATHAILPTLSIIEGGYKLKSYLTFIFLKCISYSFLINISNLKGNSSLSRMWGIFL